MFDQPAKPKKRPPLKQDSLPQAGDSTYDALNDPLARMIAR